LKTNTLRDIESEVYTSCSAKINFPKIDEKKQFYIRLVNKVDNFSNLDVNYQLNNGSCAIKLYNDEQNYKSGRRDNLLKRGG
jgi:hypothetical protein